MAKVIKLHSTEVDQWAFKCPACGQIHCFWTKGVDGVWKFNGDVNKPTVSPSILTTITDWATGVKTRCHSFIRDGKIEFCGDSTHKLAGKTVEMLDVDFDEYGREKTIEKES